MKRAIRALKFLIKWGLLTLLSFFIFFIILEIFYPVNLNKAKDLSRVVLDRDNRWIYSTLNSKDKWRFRVDLKKLDPNYKKMLLNYEDKNFYNHCGVDFLALIRATSQLIVNKKITSGGSTITMQLARLLEPKERTISSKIIEIFRAFQLERHYTKDEILSAYLTLAPYGGNVEGVVGASKRYFNKLPNTLTLSQSAILVALPQSPERNRPDKSIKKAKQARNKVLLRAYSNGLISKKRYESVRNSNISIKLYNFPRNAYSISTKALKKRDSNQIETTLFLPLQIRLEKWAKESAQNLPRGTNLSLVLIKNKTGEVISYIGSYDRFNKEISGYIDLNQAIRSPGSVLKPLIYAMALEDKIADVNTIILDKESQFSNYKPHNFNKKFNDEVTLSNALQNSLNIPAIKVLQKVGANNFINKLQKACGKVVIPKNQATLPTALGGLGITPYQVAKLYTAFASKGKVKELYYLKDTNQTKQTKLLTPKTAQQITDILREAPPPNGFSNKNGFFAFKTGTSYGYRDFWSAIYSKEYTLVLLIAKANNRPIIKASAREIALPLAFEAMGIVKEYLPHNSWQHPSAKTTSKKPTPALKYLNEPIKLKENFEFLYPKEGTKFQSASCNDAVVEFKLKGGIAPYIWYVDDTLKKNTSNSLIAKFKQGGHTISAIDSSGNQSVVNIWVKAPNCE